MKMIDFDATKQDWIYNKDYFITMIVFAVLAILTTSLYNLWNFKNKDYYHNWLPEFNIICII